MKINTYHLNKCIEENLARVIRTPDQRKSTHVFIHYSPSLYHLSYHEPIQNYHHQIYNHQIYHHQIYHHHIHNNLRFYLKYDMRSVSGSNR